jgi:cytochrome c553
MIRRSLARNIPRMSLWSALLLICAVARAGDDLLDLRRIEALHGDAAAGKTGATVCGACHGPLGIAPVPLFPNLAGQKAEYLYWRLVAFKRAAKPESPMTAQVANLDDVAMRDLAAWFASLPPPAAAAAVANNGSSTQGETLYRDGSPARGIPPCQGCHGADAHGHPRADESAQWRVYPALHGQHAAYLLQRLKDLGADASPLSSSAHVMAPIARSLDADSAAAIASWLESGAP